MQAAQSENMKEQTIYNLIIAKLIFCTFVLKYLNPKLCNVLQKYLSLTLLPKPSHQRPDRAKGCKVKFGRYRVLLSESGDISQLMFPIISDIQS